MIKKKSSKETVQKELVDQIKIQDIKKEVQQLPEERSVILRTLIDESDY